MITLENIHTIDSEELRKKLAYMLHIDDALINPHEKWYHPDDETSYYILKLTGDVVIVVAAKDGVYLGFDVIEKDFDKVDALRHGILMYARKLD